MPGEQFQEGEVGGHSAQKKQNKENGDQEIQESSQMTGSILKAQDSRLAWQTMSILQMTPKKERGRILSNCCEKLHSSHTSSCTTSDLQAFN